MKYYKIFGFDHIVPAEDIEKKYLELVLTAEATREMQEAHRVLTTPELREKYNSKVRLYWQQKNIYNINRIVMAAILNDDLDYLIYLLEEVLDDLFDNDGGFVDELLEEATLWKPESYDSTEGNGDTSEESDDAEKSDHWIDRILRASCTPVLKFKLIWALRGTGRQLDNQQLTVIMQNDWLPIFYAQYQERAVVLCLIYLRADILGFIRHLQNLDSEVFIKSADLLFNSWLDPFVDKLDEKKIAIEACFNFLISRQITPSLALFEKALVLAGVNPERYVCLSTLVKYHRDHPVLSEKEISGFLIKALDSPRELNLKNFFNYIIGKTLTGVTPEVLNTAVLNASAAKVSHGKDLLDAVVICLLNYQGGIDKLKEIESFIKGLSIGGIGGITGLGNTIKKLQSHFDSAMEKIIKLVPEVLPATDVPAVVVGSVQSSANASESKKRVSKREEKANLKFARSASAALLISGFPVKTPAAAVAPSASIFWNLDPDSEKLHAYSEKKIPGCDKKTRQKRKKLESVAPMSSTTNAPMPPPTAKLC